MTSTCVRSSETVRDATLSNIRVWWGFTGLNFVVSPRIVIAKVPSVYSIYGGILNPQRLKCVNTRDDVYFETVSIFFASARSKKSISGFAVGPRWSRIISKLFMLKKCYCECGGGEYDLLPNITNKSVLESIFLYLFS
jgi:hypothetical protein